MKANVFCFFLFYFFVLSVFTKGQPTTFLKTFNSGNFGYSVKEVNANSYVVAGSTDFYYNFHFLNMSTIISTNVHFYRTDVDGRLIWEKIFQYPGYRSLATWVEHTYDDGFILTGRTNSDRTWPPDSNDIFLMKTNSVGNILWAKKFDTSKDELGFCVRQTSDSGFIISGFHDAVPVSLTGNTYAILIKTDSIGNILWNKKYQFAVRDLDTAEPFPWVVRQTRDKGFVLVGTTVGSHAADILIIKTDSVGNVLWSSSYEHDSTALRFSVGLDIIETWSGDFVVAGSMDKNQALNQYNYPYILKINSTGDIIDTRFYDSAPAQLFQSGFSAVEQTTDGGFFFTGMGGYGGFGMVAQLLKTDASFNLDWSRSYSMDGAATVGSRSGCSTSDGCYVFTGKKMFAGSIIMKTDHFGFIPCKIPGSLIEMRPSVFKQSRFPMTLTGINSSNILFVQNAGLADTSTICPNSLSVLPIELISFEGKEISENTILLNWKTASEINNDYFNVERSTDGENYYSIGIVKGFGNSSQDHSYQLTDYDFGKAKINYYRLDQTDFDGSHHYSFPIAVKKESGSFSISNMNINRNEQTISITALNPSVDSKINLMLSDITGKIIHSEIIKIDNQTEEKIILDMKGISNGVYILTLENGSQKHSYKLVY